jgi:hypothetical protein
MERDNRVSYAQMPPKSPYPEPDGSNPYFTLQYFNIYFNTILTPKDKYKGSIVQYSHRVWGTHETSEADQNVFK